MRFVAAVVVSCAVLSPSPGSAQVDPLTAWAAGETVTNIIGEISDQARDRIAQLEGAGSNIMMEGRTHIIVAVQNGQLLADKLREKTFKDLTDQQKLFFGNLKLALDQFDASKNDSLVRLNDLIGTLDLALGTIPGADKSPRIAKYTPSYVVMDKVGDFKVNISGGWIGYGDPSLTIGGGRCSRETKTDRLLTFTCKKASLSDCDTIRGRSLSLKVHDRPGWFSWLQDLFREPPSYGFDVGISCVPEKAADLAGVISLSTMIPERRPRGQNFYVGKGHCEGPTPINWTMNADAANRWQIDVPTIKAVETSKIGNTWWGLADVTSASFAVRGSVGNHGRCGPRILGQRVPHDGRRSLGVRVDFEEIRSVPKDAKQEIDSFQMAWGNDYTVPMPAEGVGFVLSVRQMDGKHRVATSVGDHGWFSIRNDPGTKVIHVHMKSTQEAFSAP